MFIVVVNVVVGVVATVVGGHLFSICVFVVYLVIDTSCSVWLKLIILYTDKRPLGRFTPTAAWFRWLQYLRQSEHLLLNQAPNRVESSLMSGDRANLLPNKTDRTGALDKSKRKTDTISLLDINKNIINKLNHADSTSNKSAGNKQSNRRQIGSRGNIRAMTVHDHGHPDHDHSLHHG